MKHLLLILSMLVSMMIAQRAMAADGGSMPVPPPAKPTPKLVKVGADYFIDMQDGRVAGLFQTIGKVQRSTIGMRQIENTCDYDQALTDCELQVDVAPKTVTVRWVKHPEPQKINQLVKAYEKSNGQRMEGRSLEEGPQILWWYHARTNSGYTSNFKADRLACKDLTWAKNLPAQNSRVTIDSWASELMFQSSETNVNENQSVTTVFDVTLKKTDPNTLEFLNFGPAKYFIEGLPPHISTQVATLTLMDNQNRQCQVSFEASLDVIVKLVGSEEFKKMDPATQMPLRDGKALENTRISSDLKSILRADSAMEFE